MEKRLRVLIADDSEDDALLLVRELRREGLTCSFQRVDTADELSESLQHDEWDFVVTDHNMPSFSSSDALKIVNTLKPELPVIVVSGTITDEIAVHSMKSGAKDYIMKDNLSRLVPVVERELNEVEQRAARVSAEARLAYLSHHDTLTNLMNREQFKHSLEEILKCSQLKGSKHALVYIDLDQFKIINETCGLVAGDELLKQMSVLIQGQIGDQDRVSRMGGDEFGVLLSDCTLQEATAMATKLHSAITDFRFDWEGHHQTVSASVGVVQINRASVNVEEVLSSADMACFAAKDKGRNYIQVYDLNDADLNQRRDQMHWATYIRQALDEDTFVLYKQAIVGLKEESYNYEFLVRMEMDDTIYPPGCFIPAAERFNLMSLIDRWVINHAFSYVRSCLDENNDIEGIYFINLSGSSLNNGPFFDYVKDRMQHYHLPRGKVCFEITETIAISDVNVTSAFISEIRELGFLFALDDFGAGMSSFTYLKALPVDILKIDGGFVRNMVSDPMDLAIVDACNSIAHSAGLKTVAEFVENQAIQDKLIELGVDFAQGYGIEKPKPINE